MILGDGRRILDSDWRCPATVLQQNFALLLVDCNLALALSVPYYFTSSLTVPMLFEMEMGHGIKNI
jgi:hypothetical protein